MNPLFLCDFYKVGHISQYPSGVTQVWSNWTARSSRIPGQQSVALVGLRYLIERYLMENFEKEFLLLPKAEVVQEYRQLIQNTLGVTNPRTDHIEALHDLGFLPIKIYAIPEGCSTPLNCPQLVVTNTLPEFFWLPNYLESLLSAILWMPSTSATTARRYRKIFEYYAVKSGEQDLGFIDWQGHDFSFRGMGGLESAILSGLGHLTCFSGTDTIPAIVAANKYYGASLSCGGSVPATEHSVMCAGEKDGEFDTFKRLITEVYPSGIVSIVSDTWDLWKVLQSYVPQLKHEILARDGKVVIRPDSGDPVNILCGDPNAQPGDPARWGALRLLERAMGVDAERRGLPMLNKVGAIYGDSITPERAEAILDRTVNELMLSPFNLVFGIGSFTYQYVTRDTYGFAMKATAVRKDGKVVPIFKDPVTDNGTKRSHKGIPAVYRTELSTDAKPEFFVQQGVDPEALDDCAFELVFADGKHLVKPTFDQIRKRVRA
jgi:nicotinamide phosphoribosyltransferase